MSVFKRLFAKAVLPLVEAQYNTARQQLTGLSIVAIMGDLADRDEARLYLDKVRVETTRARQTLEKYRRWAGLTE